MSHEFEELLTNTSTMIKTTYSVVDPHVKYLNYLQNYWLYQLHTNTTKGTIKEYKRIRTNVSQSRNNW